ncbi:MAG TPA: patatin-like phospholipase family protein, partial [Candidatus Paceibacterota bacterium]
MSKLHSSLGKIGFVLHGGFMRGAFQVGALKAFDEFRLYPSYIVGESVGAINGAAFAAGKVELLWKIYLEIAKNPHRYIYRYNFYMLLRAF